MNQQQYYNDLLQRSYVDGYEPDEEQILLRIDGNNIGSVQNYIIISGLPKSGKSTFLTSIVASHIKHEPVFGIELTTLPNRGRVCYIDTESSEYDFYRHMSRIKEISKRTSLPETFNAYALRKDEPDAIRNMITAYCEYNKDCSVIIIDGLLDICMNYNDEVECRKVVNWLKNITTVYNCLVIGILHTGKRDGQTLGHLGSNTDRWAQSTMQVIKDELEGTFELTPKFLRSSKNFEPIKIKYDDFEREYVMVGQQKQVRQSFRPSNFEEYTVNQHHELLDKIFLNKKTYEYDELIKQISRHDTRGVNNTKKYIKYMKEKNYIDKDEKNNYYDTRISF